MDDAWPNDSSEVAKEQHRATHEVDLRARRSDPATIIEVEVNIKDGRHPMCVTFDLFPIFL
jgi:hypothetical protein